MILFFFLRNVINSLRNSLFQQFSLPEQCDTNYYYDPKTLLMENPTPKKVTPYSPSHKVINSKLMRGHKHLRRLQYRCHLPLLTLLAMVAESLTLAEREFQKMSERILNMTGEM